MMRSAALLAVFVLLAQATDLSAQPQSDSPAAERYAYLDSCLAKAGARLQSLQSGSFVYRVAHYVRQEAAEQSLLRTPYAWEDNRDNVFPSRCDLDFAGGEYKAEYFEGGGALSERNGWGIMLTRVDGEGDADSVNGEDVERIQIIDHGGTELSSRVRQHMSLYFLRCGCLSGESKVRYLRRRLAAAKVRAIPDAAVITPYGKSPKKTDVIEVVYDVKGSSSREVTRLQEAADRPVRLTLRFIPEAGGFLQYEGLAVGAGGELVEATVSREVNEIEPGFWFAGWYYDLTRNTYGGQSFIAQFEIEEAKSINQPLREEDFSFRVGAGAHVRDYRKVNAETLSYQTRKGASVSTPDQIQELGDHAKSTGEAVE